MIACRICNQKFNNVIGWKHLKKHNLTTAQYKEQYGEVASLEYKQKRSEMASGKNNPMYGKRWLWNDEQKAKIKGRVPVNKNTAMSTEQKNLLSEKGKQRHKELLETGTHPTKGKTYEEIHGTDKAAELIANLSTLNKGKHRTQESINKAIDTRKQNGLPGPMLGKRHSEETRKKIAKSSKHTAIKKRKESIDKKKKMLESIGYSLESIDGIVLNLVCDQGHQFTRTSQILTNSKFKETICPICNPPNRNWVSSGEVTLNAYINSLGMDTYQSVRTVIKGELDIYLPEYNLAIEYNGLYWHNDTFKERQYHLNKTLACNELGIHLIHIFEDELVNNENIVKSRISGLLGQNRVIYGRKTVVKAISSKLANQFLNENHIQGAGRANVHLGLIHDDELVMVMTFLHNDISKKVVGWELNRMSSKQFTNVVGGASKLFKYFIKKYSPDKITTFSDLRWSKISNNVYEKLDFIFEINTPPNYWYTMPNQMKRFHRYGLRKPNNELMTERELRNQQGWNRIWDCGNAKYVWTNN